MSGDTALKKISSKHRNNSAIELYSTFAGRFGGLVQIRPIWLSDLQGLPFLGRSSILQIT